MRCEWRITATHGEKILLNVTELDLPKSDNCRSDYLEIRDGYWLKSPIIGKILFVFTFLIRDFFVVKLCGKKKPADGAIVSTGSRLTISLVTTPRALGFKGFSASYQGNFNTLVSIFF